MAGLVLRHMRIYRRAIRLLLCAKKKQNARRKSLGLTRQFLSACQTNLIWHMVIRLFMHLWIALSVRLTMRLYNYSRMLLLHGGNQDGPGMRTTALLAILSVKFFCQSNGINIRSFIMASCPLF